MTKPLFALFPFLLPLWSLAQDDLLNRLGTDSVVPAYTTASFKTTRVINGQSIENTGHGVLDVKISHRFGLISGGTDNFFGLDGPATIRLGADYGVTDRLMIGLGRSNHEQTVDAFAKYKVLRQCQEGCSMPVTLSVVAASSVTTLASNKVPWYDEGRTDYFSNRLSYSWQVLIGRKFSESFSLQLSPGLLHMNLVKVASVKNDLFNLGIGARQKLTKRIAITAEYFYLLPDQGPVGKDCISVGFDIETGGHVFQLHFTNSQGMFERAYIAENTGSFFDGDIRYGFNISRVFTVYDPKKKAAERLKQRGG